jgi:hypothetical protein
MTNYQILSEKLRMSEWEPVSFTHDERVEIRKLAYVINMEKNQLVDKNKTLLEQVIKLKKELSALRRE